MRALLTKEWTSKSGKHHRGGGFTQSGLAVLLRNVLYIGEVCHKGVVYPGEQPAIVDRALWERVQQQFKVDNQRRVRDRKVEVLLSGVLYCAQCGERMRRTYSSRRGRRHLYYVCRNKKADAKCHQQPVAAIDLEASLIEQLQPILGAHFDTSFLQRSLERITYESRTREVGVTLVDRNQFGYTLPVANRPGVRRSFEEQQRFARVPRVSRLMALALRFQDLLSQRTVRNHAELARLGHVSRVRVCQILMLTNLAPTIQEALLFLPKIVRGRDRITEKRLRRVAKLVDWDAQIQLFRRCAAGSQQ
jgi:Recombinase zinc beta ribbon domain/Recombinase